MNGIAAAQMQAAEEEEQRNQQQQKTRSKREQQKSGWRSTQSHCIGSRNASSTITAAITISTTSRPSPSRHRSSHHRYGHPSEFATLQPLTWKRAAEADAEEQQQQKQQTEADAIALHCKTQPIHRRQHYHNVNDRIAIMTIAIN